MNRREALTSVGATALVGAVETLFIAAKAFGITASPDVAFDSVANLTYANDARPSPRLPGVTRRQSLCGPYVGLALTKADRNTLQTPDPGLNPIRDSPTCTILREPTSVACGAQMDGRSEVARNRNAASGRPSLPRHLGSSAAAMPCSLRRPPAQTLLMPR